MATIGAYPGKDGFKQIASQIRTTVETAFYGNNVHSISTVAEAYRLAEKAPGTVEIGRASCRERV